MKRSVKVFQAPISILKSSKSFTKSPLYNVCFVNTKHNRFFWKIGYSSRV
ncbi:hypothetical protein HanPI659440_Chr06g0229941 [Helianthus annuus]|nr:hypothetical protein HanPI659440_Chr06g0229941 [Helianthus annuus]